jgi:hypothetical protein
MALFYMRKKLRAVLLIYLSEFFSDNCWVSSIFLRVHISKTEIHKLTRIFGIRMILEKLCIYLFIIFLIFTVSLQSWSNLLKYLFMKISLLHSRIIKSKLFFLKELFI